MFRRTLPLLFRRKTLPTPGRALVKRASPASTPAQHQPAQPPAPAAPSLASTVAEGFAFGIGSAIARNLVGSLWGGGGDGGSADAPPPPPPQAPAEEEDGGEDDDF